jgi:hypothetical protein
MLPFDTLKASSSDPGFGASCATDGYPLLRSLLPRGAYRFNQKAFSWIGFCNGKAYAKAQTNGGSTYGADQESRCTVWIVAGEDDHAALSNERYMGGHG